ncbi:EAL domain-containing protein [Maridesulfovibrio hydrothermalis]|uniref:Diguanylate cyclase/phosphodiesterase with PAS/PAC and GAF sensor(S) n=1 Tax=Maridesulfovibrio hydrothermalis AM13 = DSM 14728 TaxID=1121451 RepID=L0RFR1_9BACT|nr:EAL domain-containing protein [Maridesulfovibrio hydrothermalis]CCO25067.1 Diguanylate cyclase/phosphodiesterase with PAS/PAC and GAF sensor(S) [Maridesulfovibrio hydrothermalis AM13 = DSM 14728]
MHEILKKQLKNAIGNSQEEFSENLSVIINLVEKAFAGFDASSLSPGSPFLKILDFLPDPAFLINKEGIVVAWNPALAKMTGVPASEVIGKGHFEHIKIVHGKRTPGLIDVVNGCDEIGLIDYDAISRRGNALAAETRIQNLGNRKSTNLWVQAAPITDQSGRTIGAIESLRDISGRKQTENINLILYKISAALNSTADTATYLKLVHESLKQFVEAENFFVATYDEVHQTLQFPYYSDEKDHINSDEVFSICDGNCLSAKVIEAGHPLLLHEEDFSDQRSNRIRHIGSPAKSWLGVPLKYQDHILGVMTIQSYKSADIYNHQDIDMMVAISEQIAAALQRREAEQALQDSEKKFRSIFENATIAIFQISRCGHLAAANPAMSKIMGYDNVEMMMERQPSIFDYIYDRKNQRKLLRKLISDGAINGLHLQVKHKDNQEKWVTLNARTLYDNSGRPTLFTGTAFDSTPEIVAERKIFRHKSRFMQLFESSPQAIALTDAEGNVVDTNKAFTNLFGYKTEQMAPCCENLSPSGRGKLKSVLKEILSGETYRNEELRKDKNGNLIPVSVLGYPFMYNNEISGAFIIYDDISQRKEYERKLSHQSLHDSLTGMPNRTLFLERLEQTLTRSQQNQDHNFAVLMLDIDMFKRINDSLGHQAGDNLLIEVGQRIKKCVRNVDTVARMGGDEFAVLIDGFNTHQQVIQIIRDIRNAICVPVKISSKEIVISSSIGIVFKTSNYEHPEHIVRDADISMYKAKEQGVNKFKVFNKAMHEKALKSLLIETEIRQGIPENEFFPYFQPVYCLHSKRLAGFEALVRWNHPQRGFLTPDQIIPVAEETGLIVELDRMVMLEACHCLSSWLKRHPAASDLFLTVNLSPSQLSKPDLAEAIEKILYDTGVSSKNIKLEITESAIMERNTASSQNLKRIEEMGIKLAVDDFGTGYSSLAQLQRFPASTVKVDRSFVSRMAEDHESLEIVRAVNALGHSLSMDVIAEGVETRQQLILLKQIGCDYVQGFYFDKPQTKEDAEKLVKMRAEGFCPPGLTSM